MAITTRGIDYKTQVTGADTVVSDMNRIGKSMTDAGAAGDKATSGLAKFADSLAAAGEKITFVTTAAKILLSGIKGIGQFVREGAALADAERNFARIGLDLKQIREQSSFTQTTEEIQKAVTATNSLVSGLKLTKEQTQQLYNASAGLADAYNKDLEPTIHAVVSAANGNVKALQKQFGVYVDTEAALKNYASSLGLTVDALTKQQKAAALANETIKTLQETSSNWPSKEMVTPLDQLSTAFADLTSGAKMLTAEAVASIDEYTGVFTRLHKAVTGDWSTPANEQLSRNEQELENLKKRITELKEEQESLQHTFKQTQVWTDVGGRSMLVAQSVKRTAAEGEKLNKVIEELTDLTARLPLQETRVAFERVEKQITKTTIAANQAVRAAEAEIAEEREAQEKSQAAARAKYIAQYQKDQESLMRLIKEGEQAAWDAVEHTEIEQINRTAEKRKQTAQETIKDAKILAQALAEIENQTAESIARAQDRAQKARITAIEEATQMAQSALMGAASVKIGRDNTEEGAVKAELDRTLSEIERQAEELAKARAALISAAGEGAEETREQLQQIADQEMALFALRSQAELDAQAKLTAARERDARKREKEYRNQKRQQYDLTEAQKEAVAEQVQGLQMFASAGKELFGNAGLFQAAEMLASGIQSGADAAHYAAESIAAYASGNIAAGTGFAAAAAASTAAAVKYAAGLAELGAKGFSVDSSAASAASAGSSAGGVVSSRALTGDKETSQPQELTVNLTFQGESANVGRYLIDKINSEAYTKGGSKINSAVIRR